MENPIKLFLVAIILVASIFAPVELSMWPRRQLAEALYSSGYETASKFVYGSLAYDNDVVGTANFYMLKFRDVYPTREETYWKRGELRDDKLSEALIELQSMSHIADYNRLMLFSGLPATSDMNGFIGRKLKLLHDEKDPEAEKIIAGNLAGIDQVAFVKRLADLGHVYAAYNIASYAHHHSEESIWKGLEEKYLLKAAERGFTDAMVDYGRIIRSYNPSLATKWINKAAELGSVPAAIELGRCYEQGGSFCEKQDLKMAVLWYKKAVLPNLPIVPPHWEMENGIIRMTFIPQNQRSESLCNCDRWGLYQLLRLAEEQKMKSISKEEILEYKRLLNIDSPNEFKL